MVLESLAVNAQQAFGALPVAAKIALVVAFVLAIWRLWRFTIMPALHPEEPEELPYWIPILGHLVDFFNNSDALLTQARIYFGNTKKPYALTVAGMKTYFITNGRDVAEAYKNTDTLSFAEFSQMLLKILGASEPAIQVTHEPLPRDKDGFPNPKGLSLTDLARQMHTRQLMPGERLDPFEHQFYEWFDERLCIKHLPEASPQTTQSCNGFVAFPLMDWCSDLFTQIAQKIYFGPQLSEIDPGLVRNFIEFDELSHQVIYQYPSFLAKEMRAALDRMRSSLKRYIQVPRDLRTGGAWYISAIEEEMRAVGVSEDDMATVFATMYWAVNSNFRKAAFWLLAYMLQTPSLLDVVREETKAAFRDDDTIDYAHIYNRCPQLEAMWNEMLRLTAYAASVRFITEDTVIGGKLLRKGNRIVISYRQLHFDESVFGAGVEQFKPDRFLKRPELTRSYSFRPWGGGNTMCPGRHVAKRVVLVWLAVLLRRFDVETDGPQPFPGAEEGKPVIGLMSVKSGEDLRVRLRPRTSAL